jgi:hypothetical protein
MVQEVLRQQLRKNDEIYDAFKFLYTKTENKDISNVTSLQYGSIVNKLSKAPYTSVANYLAKQYGEPLKRARPLTPDASDSSFTESKSGNGMKKWKSIMKKRVY